MAENENVQVVLEFQKKDDGISVVVHDGSMLDIIVGIAETIELIIENTDETKESILKHINTTLDVLEEKEVV